MFQRPDPAWPCHEWLAGVGRGGDHGHHDPGGEDGVDHHVHELCADTEHCGQTMDNDSGKHLPHAHPVRRPDSFSLLALASSFLLPLLSLTTVQADEEL